VRRDIAARDKTCRVTGFSGLSNVAAHIVARNHAEQSGVRAEHVDHPANMIMLLRDLEQAYDRFEWCFDEHGTIHILYRYTKISVYLVPTSRVNLVPESEGGPRPEYIRMAHQIALDRARERCADCWQVRVDLLTVLAVINVVQMCACVYQRMYLTLL
jgi:hypothetical protein